MGREWEACRKAHGGQGQIILRIWSEKNETLNYKMLCISS